MKRVMTGLLPLAALTGSALITLPLTLASSSRPGSEAIVASQTAPALQLNGYPVPEPLSIVLSSLALLGWTTVLRRNRMNRRS